MPLHSPDQKRVYDLLESVIMTSLQHLTGPFGEAASRIGAGQHFDVEQFLQAFLVFADKFSDGCCIEIAEIVRGNTTSESVRGTPTRSLAKTMRIEVFANLDRTLETYATAMMSLSRDFESALQEASERSVTGAVLKGALAGRVIGGFDQGGNFMARAGGLMAGLTELAAKKQMLERAVDIDASSAELALGKVDQYLRDVPAALRAMIDYAATHCFGPSVDLAYQKDVTDRVVERAADKVNQTRRQMEQLVATAVEREEKFAAQEASRSAEEARLKKAKWMIWGGAFAAFAGGGSLSTGEIDVGTGILWLVGGIALAVWGIHRSKRVREPLSNSYRVQPPAADQDVEKQLSTPSRDSKVIAAVPLTGDNPSEKLLQDDPAFQSFITDETTRESEQR